MIVDALTPERTLHRQNEKYGRVPIELCAIWLRKLRGAYFLRSLFIGVSTQARNKQGS